MTERLTEGWTWLHNARKWHYFTDDHKSLCGRWGVLTLGGLEQGNDDSKNNCTACKKALKLRQQKAETAS